MDFLFLTFVVILCWIFYLILQWSKTANPSKDGTMLYVPPQKADDRASEDSTIFNEEVKEVEETQVEKIEEEDEGEEEELEVEEFEEEKFKPEVDKVIAEIELKADEVEAMKVKKEEKEADVNDKKQEKWDEDFLSYDEQVTEDEFDVRVAEILIQANEMSIAQESICNECSEEREGECREGNETECCAQNEDKLEAGGETEKIVVSGEVTSIQNLKLEDENGRTIIEGRPYREINETHEVNETHINEKSKTNDEALLQNKEIAVEKSEGDTAIENTMDEKELKSTDIKIGFEKLEDELRNSTTLNFNFTSKTEDEPDNLHLGYNKDSPETGGLSQCINTALLDNETRVEIIDKTEPKYFEKYDENEILKDILTKTDNEDIEKWKEESEVSGENKEDESEVGEEVNLLSKQSKDGDKVVESEIREELKPQSFEQSKEDAMVEQDFETNIVIEDKEIMSEENKEETEEAELTSKEATLVKDKNEIGIENKDELIFKCQLLPILHFKENKDETDEAELMSKHATVVEDKDDIGIDDKEEFLSKENKEDSFLQILKDLQEAESPKGIKEAIELLEDDDEEVFEKPRIIEHNDISMEDISVSKEEREEILKETNVTEESKNEILEDTNVEVEVLGENKQEFKIMKDFKGTETPKDDKYATNITDVCQSEPLKKKDDKIMEDTEISEEGKNDKTIEEIFLNEDEKNKGQTEVSETIHGTIVLKDSKEEPEILAENEKGELRVNVITENSTERASITTEISEHSEEKGYMENQSKDEEKWQHQEEPTYTEIKNEEIEIHEEEEESKMLKDLKETESSTSNKETEMSNTSKDEREKIEEKNGFKSSKDELSSEFKKIHKTDTEVTESGNKNGFKSSKDELSSEFKEIHKTDTEVTESGNKNFNVISQKEFRDFHSSEIEKNSENKTVIITHEGDYVHNYNEEIQISEVIGKEILTQQKIEYTEVADEEEVLYRNVVKCGEEEFVEEFQTKNEIFNEKSCTSSVVTNEEISSSQQTTSTTITKVVNLSYTSEECSTENIEIRTIIGDIGDKGNFIPLTDNEQFKKLDIGLIKDIISSDGSLKENASTLQPLGVENISNDSATEFKKPVGGVYLFGGEEFMNKIKSRKLIVDGYEKEQNEQLENGEEWRLSKLSRDTNELTSRTTFPSTSSSKTTTTTMTSQMRNQKSQMKQDIKQIHLSSNAFDKSDAVPVLSANMSQPSFKEDSTTHFSESHFQDGFTMTSHNGSEGEIISEIPTFQTESSLIHLNKDRNKGPVRRRKPEKSKEDL